MALLEADVSFKVVKQFMKSVQEKAVGQDVMNGLNPGQMVIKIVHDELVAPYGGGDHGAVPQAGKRDYRDSDGRTSGRGVRTTTAAKLAGKIQIQRQEASSGSLRRVSARGDYPA